MTDADRSLIVSVPREPTTEMMEAGADNLFGSASDDWKDDARVIWNAMLAAAPATPPHNEEGLRKALEGLLGWGQHDEGCAVNDYPDTNKDCNCGLRAAERVARQALGDIPSG